MKKVSNRAMKDASYAETDRAKRPYRQGTFAALKLPAYRVFFGALLMQMTAMNMQMVARTWFMYELTGSAAMLGAVGLGSALPILTVSLFGGVLADRIRKRSILVAGQFASALVALGIAVSISVGAIACIGPGGSGDCCFHFGGRHCLNSPVCGRPGSGPGAGLDDARPAGPHL
jgi:MFS family permease